MRPAALVVLPLVLSACGLEPKLSVVQEHIFQPSCATSGCHSAQARAGQLDLSAGHARAQLVDVPAETAGAKEDGLLRVKPGDPEHSLLVLKVRAHVPLSYGTRMPQGAEPLSDDAIEALTEWVRLGAKDD